MHGATESKISDHCDSEPVDTALAIGKLAPNRVEVE
jgi:hypothetical protein